MVEGKAYDISAESVSYNVKKKKKALRASFGLRSYPETHVSEDVPENDTVVLLQGTNHLFLDSP